MKLLIWIWHFLFGCPGKYVTWGSLLEGAHCRRCGARWYLWDFYV